MNSEGFNIPQRQDSPATPETAELGSAAVQSATLAGRTTSAAGWRFASAAVGGTAQFITGIALARLLDPSEFGLMSLALVAIGLSSRFGDVGIGAALVHHRQLTERHVRAAFTFSVTLGIVVAAALALAAPLLARLAGEPAVTSVVRGLSPTFAIQAGALVSGSMLRRRLDYRLPFFIAIVSYVGGYATVAIGLAVAGFGVWSLVYASLTQSVLSLVAHLVLAPHPLRPSFDRAALAPLLHFGVGTSMSEWMNYIARNGDNFVVGRMLGVESLGLYARAYSLMSLPFTYTTSVMSAVLFPSLSRLQDDQPRLQRAHLLMSRLTAAMSAPMMGTMAVAAAPLILTLYGPRWAGVIAPFQVLCAFGYFRALYHVAGVVAQSAGRVYAELRNQMFYALMVVAGAAIGAVWGVAGVAFGCGLAILFMYVASGHLAARATATTWPMYLRFQLTPVVFGASTAAIALLLRSALERSAVSDPVVALLLVCVGGLGTAASTLVVLSEEPYRPVVSHLPASVEWTVNRVRRVAPARAADGAAAR